MTPETRATLRAIHAFLGHTIIAACLIVGGFHWIAGNDSAAAVFLVVGFGLRHWDALNAVERRLDKLERQGRM